MPEKTKENDVAEKNKQCGIIMPISKHEAYPDTHWIDVKNILFEAISETEFIPSLVSDDPAIGIIHDRIVTNLYSNEIVICDVSSVNPNVMFELGLRLAFDKPTIIIKDERTGFAFDTGIIEHIPYQSSLRFPNIVEFKKSLVLKINATYEKSKCEENYSPFLKSFGQTIVPAKINGKEISETKYIIQTLNELQYEIRSQKYNAQNNEDFTNNEDSSTLATINIYTAKIYSILVNKHIVNEDLTMAELTLEVDKYFMRMRIDISAEIKWKIIQNLFLNVKNQLASESKSKLLLQKSMNFK